MEEIKKKRKGTPWTEERRKKMAIIHQSPEYRKKQSLSKISRKGHAVSEETKKKLSLIHQGSKNKRWKGDKVGYVSVHFWVQRWKKGPFDVCEMCGETGLKGRQIHWANIDHKYRRVLEDYIHLCTRCHGLFDREHNLRKHRNGNAD